MRRGASGWSLALLLAAAVTAGAEDRPPALPVGPPGSGTPMELPRDFYSCLVPRDGRCDAISRFAFHGGTGGGYITFVAFALHDRLYGVNVIRAGFELDGYRLCFADMAGSVRRPRLYATFDIRMRDMRLVPLPPLAGLEKRIRERLLERVAARIGERRYCVRYERDAPGEVWLVTSLDGEDLPALPVVFSSSPAGWRLQPLD